MIIENQRFRRFQYLGLNSIRNNLSVRQSLETTGIHAALGAAQFTAYDAQIPPLQVMTPRRMEKEKKVSIFIGNLSLLVYTSSLLRQRFGRKALALPP